MVAPEDKSLLDFGYCMRGNVFKLLVTGILGLSLLTHGAAAHACCETPTLDQLNIDLKVEASVHANLSETDSSQREEGEAVDFEKAHCSSSCVGFVTKSEARFFADSVKRVQPVRSFFRVSSFDLSLFKPPRA